MNLRVGIVGAGLIGSRRAAFASASQRSRVVMVADVDEGRARALANTQKCGWTLSWEDLVVDREIDAVVVSTPNKYLAPVSIAALGAGKHVLSEKPMGRSLDEAMAMASAAQSSGRVLKIGFTLRFSPALRKARQLCQAGHLGNPFYVRAVYGHGGRPGYGQEWRGDRELSGGGELLDQGVHLLDLSRWFLGDFQDVLGATPRWFWEIAPLEDNAFMLLRTHGGRVASLHTSWTQWRNRFSFEVFGESGSVGVEGLGGSYGPQRLTLERRRPESGPPERECFAFEEDTSWEDDWADFLDAVEYGRPAEVSADEGVQVMRLVDAVYAAASQPWYEIPSLRGAPTL